MTTTIESILFVCGQVTEHALFMVHAILDEKYMEYSNHFAQLYHFFESFCKQSPDQLLATYKTSLIPMIQKQTEIFKLCNSIGQVMLATMPIGDVAHMIMEQDYFIQMLQNDISPEDEIKFWIKEVSQHTDLTLSTTGNLINLSDLSITTHSSLLPYLKYANDILKTLEDRKINREVLQSTLKNIETIHDTAGKLTRQIQQERICSALSLTSLLHEGREEAFGIKRLNIIIHNQNQNQNSNGSNGNGSNNQNNNIPSCFDFGQYTVCVAK